MITREQHLTAAALTQAIRAADMLFCANPEDPNDSEPVNRPGYVDAIVKHVIADVSSNQIENAFAVMERIYKACFHLKERPNDKNS